MQSKNEFAANAVRYVFGYLHLIHNLDIEEGSERDSQEKNSLYRNLVALDAIDPMRVGFALSEMSRLGAKVEINRLGVCGVFMAFYLTHAQRPDSSGLDRNSPSSKDPVQATQDLLAKYRAAPSLDKKSAQEEIASLKKAVKYRG
ncbi:MAG: hypothetical protein IBX55_01970 [Methyloprofundus sp.]|nr:hypothetical protein [Methyloprofundus sp.]